MGCVGLHKYGGIVFRVNENSDFEAIYSASHGNWRVRYEMALPIEIEQREDTGDFRMFDVLVLPILAPCFVLA